MQNLNVSGDMEDLLVSKKDLTKSSASHGLNADKENNPNMQSVGSDYSKNRQKSTGSNLLFPSQIPNDAADEAVDRTADYQGWLDAKKRKWKYVREQRKRRR